MSLISPFHLEDLPKSKFRASTKGMAGEASSYPINPENGNAQTQSTKLDTLDPAMPESEPKRLYKPGCGCC